MSNKKNNKNEQEWLRHLEWKAIEQMRKHSAGAYKNRNQVEQKEKRAKVTNKRYKLKAAAAKLGISSIDFQVAAKIAGVDHIEWGVDNQGLIFYIYTKNQIRAIKRHFKNNNLDYPHINNDNPERKQVDRRPLVIKRKAECQ